MAAKGRIHYDNRVPLIGTTLSASSAQSSNPVSWLRDQLRSKTYRSLVGWNIGTWNQKLDFTEAGVARVATIVVGAYATGDAMAAAVQTALNTAPGVVNTYVVSYAAGTKKFTITRAVGAAAFVIKWGTGANVALGIGRDLGFAVADDSGSITYVSDGAAYHSREYILADFGSNLTVRSAIVINHNLLLSGLTPGTITLYGDNTPLNMGGPPAYSHVLAGNTDVQLYQTAGAGETARYWWLVIDDVQNPVGYSEVGVWFAGNFLETTVNYCIEFTEDGEELSTQEHGASGAHFQVQRPIRNVFGVAWQEILEADVSLHRALKAGAPQGQNFFFGFRPDADATDIVYGFRGPMGIALASSPDYTNVSFQLFEALG